MIADDAACRVCHRGVGVETYCGSCGTRRERRRGDGPDWLRTSAFAPAPDQRLWRPAVTTTFFPGVTRRSRSAITAALLLLVALVVACAVARSLPALVGLVSFGMPIVFALYLRASHALAGIPRSALLVVTALTVGTGVCWALATDAAIAKTSDDALGLPVSATALFITGVGIPMGFLLLMLEPVVVVRWWRPGPRESLHGFVIGLIAAFVFSAASTFTRLTPELLTGQLVVEHRSPGALAAAALVQAFVIPLSAAGIAGALGAALWFRPRRDIPPLPRWFPLTSWWTPALLGVVSYLFLEVLDYFAPPEPIASGSYLLVVVLTLGLARVVVHATVFREEQDPARPSVTVRCPQCEHTTSDSSFCPECGLARRALPGGRTASPTRAVLAVAGASIVIVALMVGVTRWFTPPVPGFICPPDCGRPPVAEPVATNPRFFSEDGEFSVSYPGEGTAYHADFDPDGVVLDLQAGDGGTLRLFGQPANGRTPKQVATDLLHDTFPEAKTAYEIPNAMVGYQLGYGEIADVYPTSSIGAASRLRVLVMVAVKNDYALVAAAAGPYREFSPQFGSGHPSGANFFLALDMSKYVNSFMWRGDPVR